MPQLALEPMTPSQALSPLTLPPTPGVMPGPPSDPSETGSQGNRKWQRPAGKKKSGLSELEKAPPPSESEKIVGGINQPAAVGRNLVNLGLF